jgi:hypothetical protein
MSSQTLIDAEERETTESNGSRFNAVTHGLTAKTAVLPGEDPELFQAKIDLYKAGVGTRNPLEDELAENAALASWQMRRAVSIQTARANCAVLTKPPADQLRKDLDAAEIGNRLFHDRRGPIELYPSRGYDFKQPRTSWEAVPNDPDDPEILVKRLTATVEGCRWLRTQWLKLRGIIKLGLGLQSHEKMKMIRLMGHQPINAVSEPEVARVFLACHVLEPQFEYAFQELRCEIHEDQFTIHKKRLERWNRTSLTPVNKTAARAVLLGIIDTATEQLQAVEAELQKKADQLEQQQQALLGHEEGKAGEQIRRHIGSCNRLIFGNLDAIHRFRRNEAEGWGRTREERRRRKAERRSDGQGDDPLVVDERGTLRPARGYEGNLEEGLARYEAQFGSGGLKGQADSRNAIEETQVRAVPDFARWAPPVEEERRLVEDGGQLRPSEEGAGMGEGVELEAGFLRDGHGVEQDNVVTQVLMQEGCQSNEQNELYGCQFSVVSGQLLEGEAGGRGDGGDRSGGRGPRRTTAGGGDIDRRFTERFWKRDRKQWRKLMTKLELMRRNGETQEDLDDETLKEMLDRVPLLNPNSVNGLRGHLPRSP